MKIIICIDERRGMLFNNRRQSKDRVLLEDVKNIVGAKRILCSPFSEKMLTEAGVLHISTPNFLDIASKDDFCFVEDVSIINYISRIDTLIVYNWNRLYPADLRFEIIPELFGFQKKSIFDFIGSSHEKITRELYEK